MTGALHSLIVALGIVLWTAPLGAHDPDTLELEVSEIDVVADRPVAASSQQFIPDNEYLMQPQGRPAQVLRLIPGFIAVEHSGGAGKLACANRPIDPPLLDALRLGIHQLLATRVASHAAVAATVDLVRAEIGQGAAGFANAVLRRVSGQDLKAWLDQLAPAQGTAPGAGPATGVGSATGAGSATGSQDEDARLALRHSHPEWIVRALRDALRHHGRPVEELEQLLIADNTPAEVTLAVLPGLARPQDLPGTPGELSPYAVRISGAPGALHAVRQAALLRVPGPVLVLGVDCAPDRRLALTHSAETLVVASEGDHLSLGAALSALSARKINEVHVEAGPKVNGALLQENLIDEWLLYLAPHWLGPGKPVVELPSRMDLPTEPDWMIVETSAVGSDLRLRLRRDVSAAPGGVSKGLTSGSAGTVQRSLSG